MFHNVLTPSPLYQNVFRAATLGPHVAGANPSTSFLVENLLRERTSPLLPRPVPTSPPSSIVQLRSQGSPASTTAVSAATPYLKFGVSAILGTDTHKSQSEYPIGIVIDL